MSSTYNKKRIPITETLRCKLALCLSESNAYRIAYTDIIIPDKQKSDQLKEIFGVSLNTLSNTVLLPTKEGVNISTLESIVESAGEFYDLVIEKQPEHELARLDKIELEDFITDPNHTGSLEASLYSLGIKLGFCKKEKSGKGDKDSCTEKFILKNNKPVFDRKSLIIAIDREKNLINKPGCGFHIAKDLADKLFNKYEGVYALYYPSAVNDGTQQFVKAALRISHVLNEDRSKLIRLKLNLPNINHQDVRLQYRGYLSPIGDKDHINMTFFLATNTVNQEDSLLKGYKFKPDVVNIICKRMHNKDGIFYGVLSSLNQCESNGKTVPYAAKVVLKRQNYNASEEELFPQESKFMTETGLGHFGNLNELIKDISNLVESKVVNDYFTDDMNSPLILLSNLWPG